MYINIYMASYATSSFAVKLAFLYYEFSKMKVILSDIFATSRKCFLMFYATCQRGQMFLVSGLFEGKL